MRAWLRKNVREPIQTYVAEPAKGLANSIKQNVGDPIKTAAQKYIQQPIREHFHEPFKENVQPVLEGFAEGARHGAVVIGDTATAGGNPKLRLEASQLKQEAFDRGDTVTIVGFGFARVAGHTSQAIAAQGAIIPAGAAVASAPGASYAAPFVQVIGLGSGADITYHQTVKSYYDSQNGDYVEALDTGVDAASALVGTVLQAREIGNSYLRPTSMAAHLSPASGTGQASRTLAEPSKGTFLRGLVVRWRAGSRFDSLYAAAQRNVVSARAQQVQLLKGAVGYSDRVRYLHERGSSTFNHQTGEIIIRQHAFYEPGGVKSVFLHEVGHSMLPVWTTEHAVDDEAVRIAEEVFGHSDDIVLPFVD